MFAGGAVVLAELGLLTLSRGALFTAPVVIVVFFAVVPGRLRHAAVLAVVGLAVAAGASTLLHVGDVLGNPHAAGGRGGRRSGAGDRARRGRWPAR